MGVIGCALIEISALLQLQGSGRLPSGREGGGGRGRVLQTKWKMEALYSPVALRYRVYSSHKATGLSGLISGRAGGTDR